jgi:glycine/D-amino acid oxidase-like deaminating enzyme
LITFLLYFFTQNAIIGQHSEIRNMMICSGFSGHGLQQSPAAGRAVAELLTNDNKFLTLDLSRFSFERVVDNRPIFETGIV